MRARLLLVGIDGLRADLVEPGDAPVLAGLLAGAVSRMTMPVPTMSGPGWSTLLTGAPPAVHRVAGNDFAGHRLAEAPDLLTALATADPAARTLVAASWPPLVDAAGPGPVLRARPSDVAAGRHRVLERDGEADGYRPADADLGPAAAAILAAGGADAAVVYLGEVDEAGHRDGARSAGYRAAIRRVDALVGVLLDAVRSREAAGEAWLVAVTTDHGHLDGGGHGGAEPEVATSFVALAGMGVRTPTWPRRIEPHELAPLLLAEVAPDRMPGRSQGAVVGQ